MKTHLTNSRSTAGSAMLVTLFFCGILGIMMASYLMFARQENLMSARSQIWNSGISVVEAGVEDALQHLNSNTNLQTDGWSYIYGEYWDYFGSSAFYLRYRSLPGGDAYLVSISLTDPAQPEIISRAWLQAPSFALSGSGPMFAAAGVTFSGPGVYRTVKVKARKSHLFINALTAKKQIDLNGNNIMTDSFDSSNPAYSTGGQYDLSKRRDNGGIASNDTIENTVNVGDANIYGRVATGPEGTVYVGPQGRVGPLGWNPTGNDKIYPGWFTDDMNFTFMEPEPPTGTVVAPSGGYVTNIQVGVSNLTSATYPSPEPAGGVTTNVFTQTSSTYPSPVPPGGVLTNSILQFTTSTTYPAAWTYQGTVVTREVTSGPQAGRGTWYDYYAIIGQSYTYTNFTYTYAIPVTNIVDVVYYDYILNSLPNNQFYRLTDLDQNKKVLVNGKAALDVAGSLDLASATITIEPTGSLELFAHSSFALAGNNIVNRPGYAGKFIIWADSGVTGVSYSGNASFTGVLYAPHANFVLNGGGKERIDFIGAAVVNTAYLNGHFNFHYDEDLGKMASGRFVVNTWDEL
jgi:hypothetical protein